MNGDSIVAMEAASRRKLVPDQRSKLPSIEMIMKTSMRTYFSRVSLSIGFVVATFSVIGRCQATPVLTLIDPGTDDRIASITDLELLGTIYDITFHYGVSYDSLGPDAITFDNALDALNASTELGDFINSTNTPISDPFGDTFTQSFWIPYNVQITDNVESRQRFNAFASSTYFYNEWRDFDRARTNPLPSNWAWVTFTAVPEPSALGLMTLAAFGFGVFHRRNLRSGDASGRRESLK